MSSPIHSLATSLINDHNKLFISLFDISTKLQTFNIKQKSTQTFYSNAALNRLPQALHNNTMMFISNAAHQHDLWLYKNKQEKRVVLPFEFGFTRYQPNFDHEYITFEKFGAVYEYEIKTGNTTKIFEESHQAYVINYDENSQNLIYSSNKSGQWQLWLFDRQDNGHKQLTTKGGYSGYAYNGKVYFSKRNHSGLWVLENQTEQLIIKDFSNINWLNWQLIDGKVFFYRAESGVWKFDLNSNTEQLVMSAPPNFTHQYTVHPDQSAITYVQAQPMQSDIHILSLDKNQ
ncbi:hypothetical protein [Pseudoalteromonas sp. MMG005]|uniref:TolB family protein n=1 Tax=Pseudoalteromonas sp. MMG005 TaxID=2822682 RepID=UPI001B39DECE|nr:hypothetical protein [Pseudoalteromonas sp. MMG005]MBQ4846417.1 hypothetical protein [Pseudoalteromonas sp. MMG005]